MTETREELQARWWAAWREQDFSWEGLATKPVGQNGDEVHGGLHGERNLQEYWRRDPTTGAMRDDAALLVAGELVRAPDGALWHVVHVPLTWPDGTPAKAGWDAAMQDWLAMLVSARMAAAQLTEVDAIANAIALDGRAQLQGAVLLHAPTDPGQAVPPLVADRAAIPLWDAEGAAIAAGFRCVFTNFHEQAYFDGATFFGVANFDDAAFSIVASFASAIFSGVARFERASFSGKARFVNATFSRYARFASATFAGDVDFDGAAFSSDASFTRATLSGRVSFDIATFSGNAGFLRTTFLGDAYFISSSFARYAGFNRATFSCNALFGRSIFSADAGFQDTKFVGRTSFDGASFLGDARFSGATFLQKTSFATARFRGLAFFTTLAARPPRAGDWHRAFLSTEFARTVDFEGSGLRALAGFDGIRIAPDASLLLDDVADHAAKALFRRELQAALVQGRRDAKLPDGPRKPHFMRRLRFLYRAQFLRRLRLLHRRSSADRERLRDAQDIRLKELERGCRALVVEMEKLRDRTRAQLFYRFEIEARRRQHETPRWEKITSWLYDKFGDYGASIARPLAALLVSIPLAAPLYGGVLAWQRPALCTERLQPACDNLAKDPRGTFWPIVSGSVAFSASRALPFGAWEVKAEDPAQNNPVRMLLLGEADTWQHVLIRALGTLHSVFALAMAFLSGIAIRRRFQLD